MFDSLAKHIMDIGENSAAAKASRIDISLTQDGAADLTTFRIVDDGVGMDPDRAKAVLDPFVTSRTTRRVGLGLPFLKQLAELCGGRLTLESEKGKGTAVTATFRQSSIDLPPLGDLAGAMQTLILRACWIRWTFTHSVDGRSYTFDTADVLKELDGDPQMLLNPEVAQWIAGYIQQEEEGLKGGAA